MNWGTWGVNHSKEDMCKLISESFDSGINSFDHADIYGDYSTEADFGNAFAESGIKRSQIGCCFRICKPIMITILLDNYLKM